MENTSEENPWVSKVSFTEKLYELAHKRGTFLLTYTLSLSSLQPLQENVVRRALEHLSRKCPSLRLCFKDRDGETWAHHSSYQDIDFKVITNADVDKVRDSLSTYQYNSETGPLWCARLLLNAKEDGYALDKDFPHTSKLFFGTHHSFTDGVTMVKICGTFLEILNDLLSGNVIDDDEQIGYFLSDKKDDEIAESKIPYLKSNPQLLQELDAFTKDKGIGMPLIVKAIPVIDEGEDKTRSILHVLDEATTGRFIAKCKYEGVAVNAAFTALTSASLVSFLSERQHNKSMYRLCHGHIINHRRFWSGDTSKLLGCHAHAPFALWANVTDDVVRMIWNFARELHKEMHHHLEEETPLHREAHILMNSSSSTNDVNFDDLFSSDNPNQMDLVFSNLGNITSTLTEGGPHVKPFLLTRMCSLHYTNIKNFQLYFHTFRGRLIASFQYNRKFTQEDVAETIFRRIFSIMEDVLQVDGRVD